MKKNTKITQPACPTFYKCSCCTKNIFSKLKPIANLATRAYMANIFFKAGLVKIQDWNATLELFKTEYKIGFIPSDLAAQISTFGELALAPLLLIGFATRYVSLFLLIMVITMTIAYKAFPENYYWMLLLGMLVAYGSSKLSVDRLIRNKSHCACCNPDGACDMTKQ